MPGMENIILGNSDSFKNKDWKHIFEKLCIVFTSLSNLEEAVFPECFDGGA